MVGLACRLSIGWVSAGLSSRCLEVCCVASHELPVALRVELEFAQISCGDEILDKSPDG